MRTSICWWSCPSMSEVDKKFQIWKQNLETNGLNDKLMITKVLVSKQTDKTISASGRWPCWICRKGIGENSTHCCTQYQRCSGSTGRLSEKIVFICGRCWGLVKTLKIQEIDSPKCPECSLEVVNDVYCIRDEISSGDDTQRVWWLE